jgi:hypothetical protein
VRNQMSRVVLLRLGGYVVGKRIVAARWRLCRRDQSTVLWRAPRR